MVRQPGGNIGIYRTAGVFSRQLRDVNLQPDPVL